MGNTFGSRKACCLVFAVSTGCVANAAKRPAVMPDSTRELPAGYPSSSFLLSR